MAIQIKICGVTSPQDAALATELGADILGLNLFRGPRKVTLEQARACAAAAPGTDIVVLADVATLRSDPRIVAFIQQRGGHVQVYGLEPGAGPLGCGYWLTVPVAGADFPAQVRTGLAAARTAGFSRAAGAVVLDTAVAGALGGTGKTFDWAWIAAARAAGELDNVPPLVLAGGLTADNVAAAIQVARPWAVDVSSGVEFPGQPGKKDAARMRAFIDAAKSR